MGSTEAMQISVKTSKLLQYRADHIVPGVMSSMRDAILNRNFDQFAELTMKVCESEQHRRLQNVGSVTLLTSQTCYVLAFILLYCCCCRMLHVRCDVSHLTADSSAEWSRIRPPSSFVRGQDSIMWDIVCTSPHGHRSESAIPHLLWQAAQWPWAVRNRFLGKLTWSGF